MRTANGFTCFARIAVLLLVALAGPVFATPVTVADAFNLRTNTGPNPGNFPQGNRLTFGAASVTPNGAAGTTGSGFQDGQTVALFSRSFDIVENQFIVSIPYVAALTDPWQLTFVNGPDTTVVSTPAVGNVALMPLATGLGATGSVLAPTLSWTIPAIPAGVELDSEGVVVFDLNDLVTLNNGTTTIQQPNGIFASLLLAPSTTSFVLPSGILQPGGRYLFQVVLSDFRAPPTENTIAAVAEATLSRSNTYLVYLVPEPGSAILLLTGLLGMMLVRGRVRR